MTRGKNGERELETETRAAESDSDDASEGPKLSAEETEPERDESVRDATLNMTIESRPTSSNVKCVKCNRRLAREGCTQSACILCCEDLTGCESHRKPRLHALWKEQVLAGTTEVQQLAAAKRKMRIPSGRRFFREPGFVYQGDTVVIWDLQAYAQNPKWRDDAVRKAVRRSKSTCHNNSPTFRRLRNSRKRFRRLMHEFYLKFKE